MIRKSLSLFFILISLWGVPIRASFKNFSFENFPEEEKKRFMKSAIHGGALFTIQYCQKHPYIIHAAQIGLNNGVSAVAFGGSSLVHYKFNNNLTRRLIGSSCNGLLYNEYYNDMFSNLQKDNSISSASLRQVLYMPVDMAVSEALDKVAELASVKMFTDNLSEEKKNFFKKHLTVVTSVVAIDTLERLTRKDYSSAYNKPIELLVVNHILSEGVIELLNLDFEKRAMVRLALSEYAVPYIVQKVREAFS